MGEHPGAVRGFVRRLRDGAWHSVLHDVYPDQCGHKGPRALLDRLLASGRYQGCGVYTRPQNFGMAVVQRVR